MKKILFIMSLVVNVLLIATVFSLRLHYHRMIFQALYNTTISEVRLHEGILAELRSENEHKVMAVKTMLEQNIREEKKSAEIWKAASERIVLK
jgi:hypothetical protein